LNREIRENRPAMVAVRKDFAYLAYFAVAVVDLA
jgi:hypothetical protein